MILPFKTKFDNGEPTYFPEKIYFSICQESYKSDGLELSQKIIDFYQSEQFKKVRLSYWDNAYWKQLTQGKPHTIRADEKNRWKPGNKIHFYINNRKPDMTLFAPVLKCTAVQKIVIRHFSLPDCKPDIIVDGKFLNYNEQINLAQNDGFKDLESFFNWFNTDFEGKIIHWTDLRY